MAISLLWLLCAAMAAAMREASRRLARWLVEKPRSYERLPNVA